MDRVTITVPARLHLGFLDMHGGLGRKFGSIGLSISEPVTRLTLARAPGHGVSGPESERAARYLQTITAHLHVDRRFALDIAEAIPGHSGLGSGTQLALAVAAAVRGLSGLELDPAADAAILGRGARSGVGIGLFSKGGLAVDGGRGPSGRPAPILAQFPFPEAWRVILILDPSHEGLSGEAELAAFAALPAFPADVAAELCRLTLMQALPSVAESDIGGFGSAISAIQRRVGEYFAAAQGGRFASARVAAAAAWLEAHGAAGMGQSSWGPTGFAFTASEAEALRLVAQLPGRDGLDIRIVRGDNHGARIERHTKASVA